VNSWHYSVTFFPRVFLKLLFPRPPIARIATSSKMSSVNITNVQVLDNPAKWPAPLQFEITFECLTPLQEGARNPNKFIIAAIC